MNTDTQQNKAKTWLKRVGLAGFLFFLFKGLAWVAVFIWAGKCAVS